MIILVVSVNRYSRFINPIIIIDPLYEGYYLFTAPIEIEKKIVKSDHAYTIYHLDTLGSPIKTLSRFFLSMAGYISRKEGYKTHFVVSATEYK